MAPCARLATYTSQETYLTGELARPDLSVADRKRYDDLLLTARYQKARLTKRATNAGGTAAFLADVDDDQVGLLAKAIEDVQKRYDKLTA